jgi:uncharacterized SAM-dependent methyltransferase
MKVIRRGGITLHDYEPSWDFAADVAAGLRETPPRIPSKYFYDAKGSELFEQITELPEYYVTRTELKIMQDHVDEMAAALGPRCALIEPGAGSGIKTRMLLAALEDPVAYIPLDISRTQLLDTAKRMAADFPQLEVAPVCADYLGDWELPPLQRAARRNVVYFPGSTIGNMEPRQARALLRKLTELCRTSRENVREKIAAIRPVNSKSSAKTAAMHVSHPAAASLLIGVDLQKDPAIIAPAYDDAQGVTRAFNLNLVERMNRELGLGIPTGAFEHFTQYNAAVGRNESYLVARQPVSFMLDGEEFSFAAGERILVEHSYKYTLEGFAELAASAGLRVKQVWTDKGQLFSVQYLETA